MEGMVVSAATGAMEVLLGKLSALLVEEHRLHKEARDDVRDMTSELEIMHAFLLEASKLEDPDELTKIRIRDVRELSYDIEDSVDMFISLADRGRGTSEPHANSNFFGHWKKKIRDLKSNRNIAIEIKKMKKQVDEEASKYKRYQIPEAPRSMAIDPRLSLLQDDHQLVGLDAPTAHITGLLTKGDDDDASEKEQRKVVSIVGAGGLGKTTLARKVYDNLKHKFACHAFVSVSQNPDITKVLRELMHRLQGGSYADTERGSVYSLKKDIEKYLEDKRYFVVLDDIWPSPTSDTATLEVLMSVLPNNNMGSRVITTTRANQIAKCSCMLRRDLIHKMEPLSDVDSRNLFLRRIFGPNGTCPDALEDVVGKILKRCGGIPLALITVSSMLATKELFDIEEWRSVEKSITSANGRGTKIDVMRKILSLSYADLPYHLRSCLLYLSIFPEDYEIKKELLILGWIGEGFIKEEQDAEEVGEGYFNELINRSLIQIRSMHLWKHEIYTCHVHDVILGFINAKSTEENFITLCTGADFKPMAQNKTRRLSIQQCQKGLLTEASNFAPLHHVRSLVVFVNVGQIHSLSNFKFLRVLDMKFDGYLGGHLPPDIGKLHLLKYLHLGYNIQELPEEIGELQNLETLKLGKYSIFELPPTITRLQRLARLYVGNDCKIPDDVGKMKNLQVLGEIVVDAYSSMNFIQQLGELTSLRVLWICLIFKEDEQTPASRLRLYEEKALASLCKLTRNLRSLRLSFTRERYSYTNVKYPNSWWLTAPVLQELEITHPCVFSGIPIWIGSLHQLKKLIMPIWRLYQRDIDTIAGIHGLVLLDIWSSEGTVERVFIPGGKQFECLSRFRLHCFNGPMGLFFEAGSMPNLTDLELKLLVSETRDLNRGFDFGIQHLSRLTTINIQLKISASSSGKDALDARATMKDSFTKNPNHPSFNFKLCRLTWIGGSNLWHDINFEDLEDIHEGEKHNNKHGKGEPT